MVKFVGSDVYDLHMLIWAEEKISLLFYFFDCIVIFTKM